MTEKVIILRYWNAPAVTAFMDVDGVGAKMDVDEYLDALVSQVTNLSFTFTKASLLAKLQEAHNNIASEMKQTTKYVV